MADSWRLIIDGRLDGALNMALDRAVQMARQQGLVPPTLRLYGWARPTVTLGRFQDAGDVDADVALSAGVDIVRRATGGRGVLHDDEVTYSVVAAVDDGVPEGVAASYRYLAGALAAAYDLLGLNAGLTGGRATGGSAACYLTSAGADLAVGGRKLSGSAQVWSGGTVLQHGSFVRSRDIDLEASLFRLDASGRNRLGTDTMTLSSASEDDAPSVDRIIESVVEGFRTALGITVVPGEWSAFEASLAAQLVRDGLAGRV